MDRTEARLRASAIELDAERQAKRVTKAEIAQHLGVEPMSVSRYLRGRDGSPVDMTGGTISRICEFLDLPLVEFYSRVEKRADQLLRSDLK